MFYLLTEKERAASHEKTTKKQKRNTKMNEWMKKWMDVWTKKSNIDADESQWIPRQSSHQFELAQQKNSSHC